MPKYLPGCISGLRGPVLFTAPHSAMVNRGGADFGEEVRVHQREKYTHYLAMKMAQMVEKHLKGQKGSFIVWN